MQNLRNHHWSHPAVFESPALWNFRISTSDLNVTKFNMQFSNFWRRDYRHIASFSTDSVHLLLVPCTLGSIGKKRMRKTSNLKYWQFSYRTIYIYIYILLPINHHHHHITLSVRISLSSLATPPYHPLLPAGPQGYIPYRYRAAMCGFELVVLLLLGHVKRSTGVHHLWACLYFSSSVPHVWFV